MARSAFGCRFFLGGRTVPCRARAVLCPLRRCSRGVPGGGRMRAGWRWCSGAGCAAGGGMGHGLYERFPVFARALDGCWPSWIRTWTDLSVPDVGDDPELLVVPGGRSRRCSPRGGLYRLMEHSGVRPDFVAGIRLRDRRGAHSGVPGRCRMPAGGLLRARLMQALPAGGVMLAVRLPSRCRRRGWKDRRVSLAAVNVGLRGDRPVTRTEAAVQEMLAIANTARRRWMVATRSIRP